MSRSDDVWSAMPPKESERFSDEQVGWICEWIAAGAPWPEKARLDALAMKEDKWRKESQATKFSKRFRYGKKFASV